MPTAVLVEQYQPQEQEQPQRQKDHLLANNEILIADISACVGQVDSHVTCPICLDNISDTHYDPSSANLHRFCGSCIKQSFGIGGLDKKFREDVQFDELKNVICNIIQILGNNGKRKEQPLSVPCSSSSISSSTAPSSIPSSCQHHPKHKSNTTTTTSKLGDTEQILKRIKEVDELYQQKCEELINTVEEQCKLVELLRKTECQEKEKTTTQPTTSISKICNKRNNKNNNNLDDNNEIKNPPKDVTNGWDINQMIESAKKTYGIATDWKKISDQQEEKQQEEKQQEEKQQQVDSNSHQQVKSTNVSFDQVIEPMNYRPKKKKHQGGNDKKRSSSFNDLRSTTTAHNQINLSKSFPLNKKNGYAHHRRERSGNATTTTTTVREKLYHNQNIDNKKATNGHRSSVLPKSIPTLPFQRFNQKKGIVSPFESQESLQRVAQSHHPSSSSSKHHTKRTERRVHRHASSSISSGNSGDSPPAKRKRSSRDSCMINKRSCRGESDISYPDMNSRRNIIIPTTNHPSAPLQSQGFSPHVEFMPVMAERENDQRVGNKNHVLNGSSTREMSSHEMSSRESIYGSRMMIHGRDDSYGTDSYGNSMGSSPEYETRVINHPSSHHTTTGYPQHYGAEVSVAPPPPRYSHERKDDLHHQQHQQQHVTYNVPPPDKDEQYPKHQNQEKNDDHSPQTKLPPRYRPREKPKPKPPKSNFMHTSSMCENLQTRWMGLYNQLIAYSEGHDGSIAVPNRPPYEKLSRWVKIQKYDYWRVDEDEGSDEYRTMMEERMMLMKKLGFTFCWKSLYDDYKWREYYEELKAYSKSHGGSCDVPNEGHENELLYRWCKSQRDVYTGKKVLAAEELKQNPLFVKRKEMLKEIGFQF